MPRGDVDALEQVILSAAPDGPLLHLRGEEAYGDIAARLKAAGLDCSERVVYRKAPCALNAPARQMLNGESGVILPLFSPRSAELVTNAGPFRAPLHVAAMSKSVAQAAQSLRPVRMEIAEHPEAQAMIVAIRRLVA